MPRFALLEHDHPHRHYDFFLETAGYLRSWRLSARPDQAPAEAESIANHRLIYLDYEGPVSGNRGNVRRIDRGDYTILSEVPLIVHLQGELLRGWLTIHSQRAEWSTLEPFF